MTLRPAPALPRPARRGRVSASLALVAALLACGPRGAYVRVEDLKLPAPVADTGYRIREGDVLSVRVWNQDAMSLNRSRVRNDGMISVPFLQDVEAAGISPAELSKRLEARLKTYVVNPIVTVAIEEVQPLRISVMGEVARPGIYDVERGSGVLAALAAAGGPTEYANRSAIFVLRDERGTEGASTQRIRFTYDALKRAEKAAALFRLRTGDVVVVE